MTTQSTTILLLVATLLSIAVGAEPLLAQADPVINEFVFDHTGIDTNEYVEVYGDPNTDYSAYTILQIEGDYSATTSLEGRIDSVDPAGTTDANGSWWTGYNNNRFENGTVTLLLVENFSGSQGQDLDTNDDGTLDATPWDRIVDGVAVNDGGSGDLTYASVVLTRGFDGNSDTVGGASRIPNGTDTDSVNDWTRNDFDGAGLPGFTGTPEAGEALNTPGANNETPTAVTLSNFAVHNTAPRGFGATIAMLGLVGVTGVWLRRQR